MISEKNAEKLVNRMNIDTNPKVSEIVFNKIADAFEKTQTKKSAIIQPNIWRIFLKSRMARLAATAMIICAGMLGIYTFVGDGASVALADVLENMKSMPWMHIVEKTQIPGTETGKHC